MRPISNPQVISVKGTRAIKLQGESNTNEEFGSTFDNQYGHMMVAKGNKPHSMQTQDPFATSLFSTVSGGKEPGLN